MHLWREVVGINMGGEPEGGHVDRRLASSTRFERPDLDFASVAPASKDIRPGRQQAETERGEHPRGAIYILRYVSNLNTLSDK